MMMNKKNVIAALVLVFVVQSADAQFGNWINKAKQKALGKINGQKTNTGDSSSATPKGQDTTQASTGVEQPVQANNPEGNNTQMAPQPPAPIEFKHTGTTTKAIHAIMAPVVDGDIQKIAGTPQGKYGFELARQKGLKGTDAEVFKQVTDPKNAQLLEEIGKAIQDKFPNANSASMPSGTMGSNPAWGGISTPSLFFDLMIGRFDTWITARYIKTSMKHDHATLSDAFGVNAVSILDVESHLAYNIGSVLGINFTTIDTINTIYGSLAMLKQEYLGLPGVKIEPGTTQKFGDYNTVSEKITIPVQPYIKKETGKKSDGLLYIHDVLSGKSDLVNKQYAPSYKLEFEFYFTHDLDQYLPGSVKALHTGAIGTEGQLVGYAIKDEKGNAAVWRLIDVQTGQSIDDGEFQVPPGYPVMTAEERKQAIRKKFGVKDK